MKVALQTLIDKSIKNMKEGIHPVVKESALEMIKRAYKENIFVQIISGFRSFEEQTKLYNQGRTTPGNIVTNAKAGQSNHNYGLAIDFALVSEDGTKVIWEVNSKWKRVAVIGKELGFKWGGDWTSFKDYPHLEMMGGLTMKELQAGKKPNLKINFTTIKGIGIVEVIKDVELRKEANMDRENIIRILKIGEKYTLYGIDNNFLNLGNYYANKDCFKITLHGGN